MLLIDEFKHIKSRADFFVALDDAIRRGQVLMKVGPNTPTEDSILGQLHVIQKWTANGRQPTKDERWRPKILVQLAREFDGVMDPVWEDWVRLVREVAFYFQRWHDDSVFRNVRRDQIPYFPEQEDDATHLRK